MAKWRLPQITQGGVLFVTGLLGAAHETIFRNFDRPILLALFGGMMGLPAFVSADQRKRNSDPPPEPPPPVTSRARVKKRAGSG